VFDNKFKEFDNMFQELVDDGFQNRRWQQKLEKLNLKNYNFEKIDFEDQNMRMLFGFDRDKLLSKSIKKVRGVRYLSKMDQKLVFDVLLIRNCNELTSLSLYDCKWITDSSLDELAEHPLLTSLNLGGSSQNDCPQVIDGIKSVAKCCPNLTCLDLTACQTISDTSINYLANYCVKLRELYMHNAYAITDSSIKNLAEHCPNLIMLNLRSCKQLTDDSIKSLAKHCPNLTCLDLEYCEYVTDSSVEELVKNNKQLKSIGLGGTKISNEGKEKLKKGISGINVSSCCLYGRQDIEVESK
jgi:hypothetical protein